MPNLTPLVRSLPATVPFVGPEAQERARGREFRARIGANELVFGPSPRAIAAMAQAAGECWKYGDPENHDLKSALARHHAVAPENIVVGEGIDALLGYLVRLLVSPGDPVVTSQGAYPTFTFHVSGFGGQVHAAPYRDDREDPDALLALARATRAPLIYFANPDNPMASWHGAEAVSAMIADLPGSSVLCLDEAYLEFAPAGTAPPIDVTNRQVIRMRTFSKAYGMAGMRVAYAIGHPDLIGAFERIRNHFAVGRIAQAGALAALGDQEWLADVLARVQHSKARIAAIAAANGLLALPSATNFVAIDCGRDGTFARRVLNGLIARDIFVRMPFVAPQDRCIRVSAGTDVDLDGFESALPPAMDEALNWGRDGA